MTTPEPLTPDEEATCRVAAVLFERDRNGRLIRRLLATIDAERARQAPDTSGLREALDTKPYEWLDEYSGEKGWYEAMDYLRAALAAPERPKETP